MLEVSGVSSFYTDPADFYRVDTALSVPKSPRTTGSCAFTGWSAKS